MLTIMALSKHIPMVVVHVIIYGIFFALLGHPNMMTSVILASLLIWVSSVDFAVYEIPDVASALLIISGILAHWQLGEQLMLFVFAGVVWATVFYLMSIGARYFLGEEGLGFGDVKLMAGIGVWLGLIDTVYVVLGASISAIITILVTQTSRGQKLERKAVAFGPFLCLCAWAVWLNGAGA